MPTYNRSPQNMQESGYNFNTFFFTKFKYACEVRQITNTVAIHSHREAQVTCVGKLSRTADNFAGHTSPTGRALLQFSPANSWSLVLPDLQLRFTWKHSYETKRFSKLLKTEHDMYQFHFIQNRYTFGQLKCSLVKSKNETR
jgi:hypothetical protein